MRDAVTITRWTPGFQEPWLPWSKRRPGYHVDSIMRELAVEAHLRKEQEEAKKARAREGRTVSTRERVTVIS